MKSIHHRTTARADRRTLPSRATWGLGIAIASGVLGCASASGGVVVREPGVATKEEPLRTAQLASTERTRSARPDRERATLPPPDDATLARKRELADASSFAAIGLLASLQGGNARGPLGSWATQLAAADDGSEAGRLFGATIDDALGFGGLWLTGDGPGEPTVRSGERAALVLRIHDRRRGRTLDLDTSVGDREEGEPSALLSRGE